MLDHSLFKQEEDPELFQAVLEFNKLYQNDPENLASLSYYKLWTNSGRNLPLSTWKQFQMDPRVRSWYSSELELSIETNIQNLAKASSKEHSYAKQQTLSALLSYKKDKTTEKSHQIFIYSFIPLTSTEEHIPNVKIIKNIPKEIANAITVYEGSEKD